jgi:iron-sulfur cluster assembly accessory protein
MWTVHDGVEDHMEGDTVQEYDSFTLYVHSMSLPYLTNSTVDYVTDITGSKIEIHNPNSQGGCGCGESVNFG